MQTKRILTILLTLCILLGCLAPAAAAVTAGADHSAHVQEPAGALELTGGAEFPSLRDETSASVETQPGGDWSFVRTDKTSEGAFLEAALPACIEELREAAALYAQDELVAAIVVLDEAPLTQTYGTAVPEAAVQSLETRQASLIAAIETEVLEGTELTVRRQFTHLANAISIHTEFANLEAIARMEGVESVFLMPTYQPNSVDSTLPVAAPLTASAGEMTGATTVWEELGFTGTGMTIAVIDTGLDLDHPSFAAAPAEPSLDAEDIAGVLGELNASDYLPGVTAGELYRSEKIPFAFNYVDASLVADHTRDGQGDHGTHVAGIAAANRVEGVEVVGMAPDAQLLIMKVFGAAGGAFMDDIVAALEDAMTLDCDVVNLSLGTSAGFSQAAEDFINEVYDGIAETDTIVNIAAGNDGTSANANMWGTDKNLTEHMDNATVSSPSTYANATSVASAENAMLESAALSLDGETWFAYNDAVELTVYFNSLAGQDVSFVLTGGYGDASDYENLDVEGKIAVVSRGVLNFGVKLANAEAAGAIGLIVTNNEPGSIANFGMSVAGDDGGLMEGISDTVPAVLVSMATGEALAAAAAEGKTTLQVSATPRLVLNEGGGQMSLFSGWGVTPDLRLQPDLTGVGGNVNSTLDRGTYGVMSGTSMASPQVSGVTTLVKEYLQEQKGVSETELRQILDGLMMSTAVPVISTDSGVEASPRQQGAGLINAWNAVTAEAYLTVNGGRPKAELGHDPQRSGVYTFSFTVHNFSAESRTYALNASLLTEDVEDYGDGLYFMAGYDRALSGSVSFSQNSVTVPAGGSADVSVTVTLSAEDKTWLDTYYKNGGYVEGFVYLTAEDEVTLSLPYMGFYGDWTQADLFDSAWWYENSAWGYPTEDGLPDGNQYFTILFTSLLSSNNWMLGFNPYVGAELVDRDGNVIYDPSFNVISNNGDGLADNISEMYISLMRNAKTLNFTYTDESGRVLFQETVSNVSKTMYSAAYGQIVPYVYSWNSPTYDFTDESGKPLPSGTKVTLTITGSLDYEGAYTTQSIQFPITLDTKAPELISVQSVSGRDGRNYVTLTLSDETMPAYAAVINSSGTQTYSQETEFVQDQETGYYEVTLDITDRGNELTVMLSDYGVNEAYYKVTYMGENEPYVDPDALYAYRVFEQTIYDDSVYGWATINKTTGETTMLTSDIYEQYALTAAEYVGGYVFAVDAGDNLVVMEPGLWDRKTICNLGTGVLDMTFDKTTDTMYLTTKGEDQYGYEVYTLSTLDLLTGEMTVLTQSTSNRQLPYAMAATDDGEIYAIKYYNRYLYKLNKSTWAMEYVYDAEGNRIEMTRSDGNTATPYYNQSMTYSTADEVIYWSFFTYTDDAELFTIDVSGDYPTYTSVPYPVNTEFVGVLTLDEDDYRLPEAEKMTQLILSAESLTLPEGSGSKITTSYLPWNYEMTGNISWSSSDTSVATVNSKGEVTAVSAGSATITATYGDVTATCQVLVVHIGGHVYAYDYYNGNDSYYDWIDIDLAAMTYESLGKSPVDFHIAEYNGHDGCYYGYDEGGSFWRVNRSSGRAQNLGGGGLPLGDMAYDYTTGQMYAISYDQNYGSTTLSYVNLANGSRQTIESVYDGYLALACGPKGELYAINTNGILYRLDLVVNQWGTFVEPAYILDTGVRGLVMAQSMAYDFGNDVLVWANPETTSLYWIDPVKGYTVKLGDPTASGALQFFGLHTIPENIGELPYTAVETFAVGGDMVLAIGGSKTASFSVEPFNATNQMVTWASDNEAVATVDETGNVTGLSQGTATITGTLVDGENSFTDSFTVVVKGSSDNIFGFIVAEVGSGNGQAWAEISAVDPTNDTQPIVACPYVIYSQEYLNGKLYAYGYDPTDMGANFHFMTINPETFEIDSAVDMGDDFPFVFDMSYDYASGTMYAVAGYNSDSSDLYMVDTATGELILLMETEPFFMSLAAYNGTLYGMSSGPDGDTAKLYKLDVTTGTYTQVFETGYRGDMLASMAFDYDTGNLYWTGMADNSSGSLYLIDMEEMEIYDLGPIGSTGSQVTGLYIRAESYPEITTELYNVVLRPAETVMSVGETLPLEVIVQPYGKEVTPTWASSDEEIVTVDAEGVVTAKAGGTATVTVTVVEGEKSRSASCEIVVYSPDYSFITYNSTDGGFANVSRQDTTQVSNLTEGEETAVRSMALVDGVIYGFDVNNTFFSTTIADGFVRTEIGTPTIELPANDENNTYYFDVRDLVWDGQRMLAVVCISDKVSYDMGGGYIWEYTAETVGGCGIYEVDLDTGALTKLTTVYWPNGGEAQNIYAMTAVDGVYYVYNSFNDYVSTIDLETGVTTHITSLQSQGLWGGTEGHPMAMDYDTLTGKIYLLFTGNGSYYRMISFDLANGHLTVEGDMGLKGDAGRDAFAGLIMNYEHFDHSNTELRDARDATCTEDGYTGDLCCVGCGMVITPGEVIPATGHSFGEWTLTLEPTCTAEGEETRVCAACGETETRAVEAHGHDWSEWKLSKENSDTEAGVETRVCAICYEVEARVIEPNGHDWSDWTVTTAPTCTAEGEETRTCDCGATETRPVPAIGHSFGEWTVSKAATCFAEGEEVRTCACGETETRAIPVRTDCPSDAFSDLDKTQWYHEGVDFALDNGLMKGMSDTEFAPNGDVTRAQLVTILYRLEGQPSIEGLENPFEDVAETDWFCDAVIWAASEGIVKGVTETTFDPNAAVTREQIATILFRYSGAEKVEEDHLEAFADADKISAYAVDAMNWAVANGLIKGLTDTTVAPRATATRAQIATILMRYCN